MAPTCCNTQAPVDFYYSEICPFAQRVWITLGELDVPHNKIHIDLSNKPEWYVRDVTPTAKVPALRPAPNEPVKVESLAIVEYLIGAYDKDGASGLLPTDEAARAQVNAWTDYAEKTLLPAYYALAKAPSHNDTVWSELTGTGPKAKRKALARALAHYEREMVGPFLTGDAFTLADIATYPTFERIALIVPRFQNWDALEPCPRLRAWIAATQARKSVKATLQVPDKEAKLLAAATAMRAPK